MKLDYGTQLSFDPVLLSIGTLKKPKLKEISALSFTKFDQYEIWLKMTPKNFFTKIKGDEGATYWDSLNEKEKASITLYDLVISDDNLTSIYLEILGFFFLEPIIYKSGYFVLLKCDIKESELTKDAIRGVITKELFPQVLDVIQQVCCIDDKNEMPDDSEFKNKLAKKLFAKMQKSIKEENAKKKVDMNYTIPNIISAVSSTHPSINFVNIWELTIFQLLDCFNRLKTNSFFRIDSVRVSVWGDEKKTYDAALWYKNEFDKK